MKSTGMNRINTVPTSKYQQGVALPIAMIMLLMMALLGARSLSSTNVQALIAGNHIDKEVSFQSAELGLKEAGYDVFRNITNASGFPENATKTTCVSRELATTSSSSPHGLCIEVNAIDSNPVWEIAGWTEETNASQFHRIYGDTTPTGDNNSVTVGKFATVTPPKYAIELPNNGDNIHCPGREAGSTIGEPNLYFLYRLTARGEGRTGRTNTILQSVYRKQGGTC